jgi:starvation-inducible DNA-binding protein
MGITQEITMEELIEKMKVVLASTFAAKLKAQSYHWNVIGSDFPQLHEFFATIYEDYEGAVDPLAEHIRQLGAFAPQTLSRMSELSIIMEDETVPNAVKMISNLQTCNENLMNAVIEAYEMAEEQKDYGLSNYLQDRITAHKKLNWMIEATMGKKS